MKPFEYTYQRLATTVQLGTQRVPNTPEFLKSIPSAQHHPQASEAVSLLTLITSSVATSSLTEVAYFYF